MKHRNKLHLALLLTIAPLAAAFAQDGPPPNQPVSAAQRHAVIQALAAQLKANYIFPDVAAKLGKALTAKEASGGYAGATTSDAFSEALSKDLREIGKDGHFVVELAPGIDPRPIGPPPVPTAAEVAETRKDMQSMAYGFQRIERLPGNVGYIELRGFGPTNAVGPAYTAAMQLMAGTDALILDLRRNGGGEPDSVAYLLSHFFAEGDERHLNDIYTRPIDSTRQYWTNPDVSVRYTKPVYVLTSKRTFSGGEECAYDFQTQKRATLVGEVTGGGANPGDEIAIAEGYAAFIPTGRSINPVTHTNWEHVGVKPDIEVPAAQAQQTAYIAILRTLLATDKDKEHQEALTDLLGKAEKGIVDPPNYSPRH
jgi:hypothetical protein